MRILVTGAGGFIGSNMIPFLKKKGHFVRGVDVAFRKERGKLTKQADELAYYDLRDMKSCMLACHGIDYVIHMAADMGGVGYFTNQNYQPFINNMQVDLNMIQACEATRVKRMFYPSSACAYPTTLQMDEGNAPKLQEVQLFPAHADQMYGWEKLMMILLSHQTPFEMRVGIQHTIYGPYQEISGERMKFPTAIATKAIKAKNEGTPIEIWGNGKQMRSFLYITDALEKIYRVLMDDTYPGPVNIGSDKAYTVTQIAQICCTILGFTPEFIYTPNKPSGVLARNSNNTLFETFYKYKDKTTIQEGFKELINWIENTNI